MMKRLLLLMIALVMPSAGAQILGCSVAVPTVNFGSYTGTAVAPGGTALQVACPILTSYTVALNAGIGSGATTTTRKMTGPGSATLSYQLFQNSSLSTNWGNTVGTDTVGGVGIILAQTIYIYPSLLANQNVAPGTYLDTITASVKTALGTYTTTFTVQATVQANCTLSATAMSLGNYSGKLVNGTSALTVTCTNTTTFNIGLNAGTFTGATVTTRRMKNASGVALSYKLFRDSGLSQNWGTTVGTDTLASTGTGVAQNIPVYGQIPAGQYVTPGSYTDTIIATITY